MTELRDRVAIVTGSTKGIGRAIAERLAGAGVHVVVSARNEAEVAEAARAIGARGGGRALGVPCDVRSLDQVRRLVQRTAGELGGVDILVNNAGVGAFAAIDELSPDDWSRVIETNLTGAFYCSREVIPHLKRRGAGWIINIGS
ncbi:MAG: SDR family NAD(P)-dependent oxidoreductase, partial [Gemmatimonadota bacterium]